ncbi:MAG: S41 family peptidase [Bryobacteraceae bacterium]
MQIEDARDQVAKAVDNLIELKDRLGLPNLTIESMPAFLDRAAQAKLKTKDKLLILDQATIILDEFYAHLPFKRARYAVDPVQRLRLIRATLDELDEMDFHSELVRTFARLRDPHTFYALPKPFAGASAFLPFRLQHYYGEDGRMQFLVTDVMTGFTHEHFTQGAHVTHYNGMPVEEAVWRETGLDSAGNEDSQFIRGLSSLFGRALDNTAPRAEHWAVLQYRSADPEDKQEYGILLPWNVMTGLRLPSSSGGMRSSIFTSQLQTNESRKALWGWDQLQREQKPTTPSIYKTNDTTLPAIFSFTASCLEERYAAGQVKPSSLRDGQRKGVHYGYLRIHSFLIEDTTAFLNEAKRILTFFNESARDGLIIDVRSNPGGNIQAAETLLQMLTPREIQTAKFHFINSKATRNIALKLSRGNHTRATQQFGEWKDGLIASLAEGSPLTPGRPLTPREEANSTGQVYQGPVILLIDALSYSATDIFAAGFDDNEIGPILGVDRNSGGGGANRWLHNELVENTGKLANLPLTCLPNGANIGVAIRRSTRVGRNFGAALEDVGVQCDPGFWHKRTRQDLEHGDIDLLAKACGILSKRPTFFLRISNAEIKKKSVTATLDCRGIDRIECYLDFHPQFTLTVSRDPANPLEFISADVQIGTDGLITTPSRLTVKGYAFIDNDDETAIRLVAANDFLFE